MAARRPATLLPLAIGAAVLAAIVLPRDPAPKRVESSEPTASATPEAAGTTALRRIALPPPPAAASPNSDGAPAPPVAATPVPAEGAVIRPTAVDAGRGLLLLARVEGGQGPAVEIAWPDGPDERRRLAAHLTRCAGWRPMLLVDGRLWRIGGSRRPSLGARTSWRGRPGSSATSMARRSTPPRMAAIRSRHGVAGGRPVATVDRAWDARLLGGLERLIEAGGSGWGGVRGRYLTDAGRLLVTAVRVDGRPVPGRLDLGPIDLGPMTRCAR